MEVLLLSTTLSIVGSRFLKLYSLKGVGGRRVLLALSIKIAVSIQHGGVCIREEPDETCHLSAAMESVGMSWRHIVLFRDSLSRFVSLSVCAGPDHAPQSHRC